MAPAVTLLDRKCHEHTAYAMEALAPHHSNLEDDLRRGLQRKEFLIYYQPIVALHPARLAGVEALVRWHHPERGILSPAQFIPVAEATGLIVPLGQWVMGQACKQLRRWQERYPRTCPLSVSVNVSAAQLRPGLVDAVGRVLRSSGVESGCLTLEITESLLMDDAPALKASLSDLKALGVRLAIDDFGTGYSSLGRLGSIPADELKIDRSFIADVSAGRPGTHLVSAIITMAHALNVKVVAEGVERPDQLDFLLKEGCDGAQGWLFGRPLPAQKMHELLTSHRKERPPIARLSTATSPTGTSDSP